jgi:ABC-2 type transport system permease protein
MPVLLLILFGYGVSLDARHVPIAIVVDDPDPETAAFAGELQGTAYFAPVFIPDMRTAERELLERRVQGIVHLRQDFARQIKTGRGAAIQVIVNGVDANYARLVLGYIEGAWSLWQQRRAEAHGDLPRTPVQLQQRVWFNSDLRSRDFLVPGLIAVIMTLIGALLTAMVMAREWERGTVEAMLVTPVRMREILLSKLITYFALGTGGMLLSVAMAVWLFRVPLRGSFAVLFLTSSLFLLVALGMGLLISTVTKNQFVAGQVAIITTFLPAFILSGFIFDIASMPWIVRSLTRVLAARYFVAILQTVFLAGNIWAVLLPNALALLVMMLVFFALIQRKSRKRLE